MASVSQAHIAAAGKHPPTSQMLTDAEKEANDAVLDQVRQVGGRPVSFNKQQGINTIRGISTEVYRDRDKQPNPTTLEEKAINTLVGVNRAGMSLWAIGWVTLPGLPVPLPVPGIVGGLFGGLAWVANKVGWKSGHRGLSSAKSSVEMFIQPLTEAVEHVSLNKIHTAPGFALNKAAEIAEKSGYAWLGKTAAPLQRTAANVDGNMNKAAAWVGEKTIKPRGALSRLIDRFANSALGRWITESTRSWNTNRIRDTAFKTSTRLSDAEARFTQKPRGFWDHVLFRKPVAKAMPSELAEALGHVQAAKGLDGIARVEMLGKAAEAVTSVKESSGIAAEIAEHAGAVQSSIDKALKTATKEIHLSEITRGGVGTWIRNIGKAVGNAPIIKAAVTLAVVAGAGAAFLNANKKTREADTALNDFIADVGDANSPLIAEARKTNNHQWVGRNVGAALSTAGESMMIKLTGNNPESMAKIIPVQMGLGMAGGMLDGENAMLSAHATLKKAEAGEVQLEPKDKVELVKQLVAMVPAVAANGGIYSILGHHVAEEIVARNIPVRDTLHLLNNAEAFNQFAIDVKAKVEAAKAAAKAEPKVADAPKAEIAKDNTAAVDNNEKPSMKIAAGAETAQLQGKVVDAQPSRKVE